ncbi:MAG TPA: RagB/SusD family nutrient uptake outer membrane protein [Bacteroidales bacterium]|nr:RagB/SusD family nutrient uptake outer membrane protein [Bacteroidales bacterium]
MKNIIKATAAIVVILLTFGCSTEYLNPVPKTSLSDLTVFDTKDRVVAQVNGMYAMMKSGQFLGGRFFVYNDVRCENFIPKSSNLVTNFATWNHTVVSSTNEVQNLWSAVYAAINAINVFLEGLDENWENGKLKTKITEAEYNQFKSEAYTLRAICYFDLLQMYSKPYNQGNGANQGVPLRLKAQKSSGENDLAPSTVAEVYTQILKDLNDAEPLAIDTYSTDLLNTTRIHRNTIIAFKTRVLMHMQNWADVVSESAKIVPSTAPFKASTGVPHELNPSYANIFAAPYTSKESIFSMPFTTTNTPGTQNGLPHYYSPSSSESYYLVTAAGSTFSKMDAGDDRKKMLVTDAQGRYFLGKFLDFTNLTNYAPVIRYAEVLLNRAEALVRSSNNVTQEAIDLLNAVRTRSFPGGAYTAADFATPADFYDAILLERNIEFLGEGMRNLDIMRLSLTIPAKDGGAMGSVPAIAPGSATYIWPVPVNELNFNKLMTPNN